MILAILFYLAIFLLLLALQPMMDLSLLFLRSFSTEHILYGVGCQSHDRPPAWRTRIFLFVWVIIFDLSVMGDPTTSYATISIALRIIQLCKPHHYVKVGISSGGRHISGSINFNTEVF
jgi:hypothetical protein